jgi:glycerophosphoryl diester phosphodiesterase
MRRILATTGFCCALPVTASAFDLQGHRGARGLAPENTLAGFATALALGVSTLELDLGMTRDGVVVVHHDLWLNPDTKRNPYGISCRCAGPRCVR